MDMWTHGHMDQPPSRIFCILSLFLFFFSGNFWPLASRGVFFWSNHRAVNVQHYLSDSNPSVLLTCQVSWLSPSNLACWTIVRFQGPWPRNRKYLIDAPLENSNCPLLNCQAVLPHVLSIIYRTSLSFVFLCCSPMSWSLSKYPTVLSVASQGCPKYLYCNTQACLFRVWKIYFFIIIII